MGSNFSGKSEKALKNNFRGFKFRNSNQSRGVALLHKRLCNRYTCRLAIYFVTKLYTYRDLDKRHEIEEYWCRRRYQLDDNGYCCLLTLESIGRAATKFVATPIIMDSHRTISPKH